MTPLLVTPTEPFEEYFLAPHGAGKRIAIRMAQRWICDVAHWHKSESEADECNERTWLSNPLHANKRDCLSNDAPVWWLERAES